MHNTDMDLYQWFDALDQVPGVSSETVSHLRNASDDATTLATGLRNLATQGVSTLPADRRLAADVEAMARKADEAAQEAAAALRKMKEVEAEAEAVKAQYRKDHDGDIDRRDGVRAPHHIEKKSNI